MAGRNQTRSTRSPTLHHAFTPVPPPCSHSLFIAASALWTSASAQLGTKLPTGQGTSVVTTPHVRAELVAHAPQGVAPPAAVAGPANHPPARLAHLLEEPRRLPALPTDLAWTLPAGLDAGEIAWPCPRRSPSARWPTMATKAPCCCPCQSPWPAPCPRPAGQGRYQTAPRGWCAARNAFPKKAIHPAAAHPEHHRCTARPLIPPPGATPARAGKTARSRQQQAQVDGNALQVAWLACPPRCAAKAGPVPETSRRHRQRRRRHAAMGRRRVDRLHPAGRPTQQQPQPPPVVLAERQAMAPPPPATGPI